MSKPKSIEDMTLEELAAEAARLNEEKVAIKAQERAIEDQRVLLLAMRGMPESLQKRIKAAGGLAPAGGQE